MKSSLIFDGIEEALKNDGANLVKKVKGIFGFKVKDGSGKEVLWIVDAKNGSGSVELDGKSMKITFWFSQDLIIRFRFLLKLKYPFPVFLKF